MAKAYFANAPAYINGTLGPSEIGYKTGSIKVEVSRKPTNTRSQSTPVIHTILSIRKTRRHKSFTEACADWVVPRFYRGNKEEAKIPRSLNIMYGKTPIQILQP